MIYIIHPLILEEFIFICVEKMALCTQEKDKASRAKSKQ
jgi:hypothetical protein